MNTTERNEICKNCEADVSLSATYCPFCGSDLIASSGKEEEPGDTVCANNSVQENLASLYKPPYASRNCHGLGVPDERDESDYLQTAIAEKNDPLFQEYEQEKLHQVQPLEEGNTEDRQGGFIPLLILSIGCQLLTLGLLLFFFSKNGKLILQWNARSWFIYCILSLPMIYSGWRLLKPKPAPATL